MVGVVALFFLLRHSPPGPMAPDTASRQPEQLAWPVPDATRHGTAEVLNGTTRAGLARSVTRLLRAQGLDVVGFGNADTLVATTQILVRRGDRGPARDARGALGVGEIRDLPDSSRYVDLTIIVGADFSEATPLHP